MAHRTERRGEPLAEAVGPAGPLGDLFTVVRVVHLLAGPLP
ncbi:MULTISPECIES: hypothetical protein [Actinoalloteichus]|nr:MULTISPECIES: hypothetical protein [Actinoalloteichus]